MEIARTRAALGAACAALRRRRGGLALVPTMGALHAGHAALCRAARASGAGVVASIFVNPLQFGPAEDFARYPRDEAGDLALLRGEGCELVWLPQGEEIYPPGNATTVVVGGPAERWEEVWRPGHFRGVATVVAKLLGQARPDLAFFGEKDWQQLQVVRRMVADLELGCRIEGVATVREGDGLALSSRNRYLSAEERARAPVLYRTLVALAAELGDGRPAAGLLAEAAAGLRGSGLIPDYLALVEAQTLEPLAVMRPPARLIAAVRLGLVRLLDNVAVGEAPEPG